MAVKKELNDEDVIALAVIKNDIGYIKKEVDEIKGLVQTKYVTKEEFLPIKNLVYGMVAVIMTGVIGAVLALVIK
jgi:hypothetical protein